MKSNNMNAKNLQINGLRAILIIAVMAYHFFTIFGRNNIGGDIYEINFLPGQAAVCAFLFLSGWFLSVVNLGNFWIKKLFKLVIPVMVAIAIVFLARWLFGSFSITPLDLSMNFLIVPMNSNLFQFVDGAHWYVAALLYFCIIFTFARLVSLIAKKDVDWIILSVFMLACLIIGLVVKPTNDIFRVILHLFPSYFAIIVCGFLSKKVLLCKTNGNLSNPITIISAILLILISIATCFLNYGWIQALYFGLLFLPLVMLCIFKRIKFLEWKPFQIVGNSSLWIYLIHQQIGYLIINTFYSINLYWVGVIVAFATMIGFGILLSLFWNQIVVKEILEKRILGKE